MKTLAEIVVGAAWKQWGDQGPFRVAPIREALRDIVTPAHLQEVLKLVRDVEPEDSSVLSDVDNRLDPLTRKETGAYFTPTSIADFMAVQLPNDKVVVDPSCGSGELLLASLRAGHQHVVGVELDPVVALAAAIRVRMHSADPRNRILSADSLGEFELPEQFSIISNPPYLGEKGNRAVFERIRKAHPELAHHFGARMDLHYLFMHRALDLLPLNCEAIFLTSEYWLTASGAERLRLDLQRRSNLLALWQLGAGKFADAPGHHSLVTHLRRGPDSGSATQTHDRLGVERQWVPPKDGFWNPFVDKSEPKGKVTLAAVARDYQGFVSGADVAFIREFKALPAEHPALWRPVLRARDCVPNRVFFSPPHCHDWALYLDRKVEGECLDYVEGLLAPWREKLSARREAAQGSMPWYRLHWPRRIEDQTGPKLVVPRRAKNACFCLDLSGSVISSDCTYVVHKNPAVTLQELVALMVVLNHPTTTQHLKTHGKTKGEIVEFYSAPLRSVPIAEWVEVELEEILGEQQRRAILALEAGDSEGFLDVLS